MIVCMNRNAQEIPRAKLAAELARRIAHKKTVIWKGREQKYGENRAWARAYPEPLAFTEIFGFDMNRFYEDPAFALETELRQRIFWEDNVIEDSAANLVVPVGASIYFDHTLFGQDVTHDPSGVPHFGGHALADRADPALIPAFDFRHTGLMPQLLRMHTEMTRLAREWYGDAVKVVFPAIGRGPLDFFVQMRGYESFVMDIAENPDGVRACLLRFARERSRFNSERAAYLGEPFARQNCFIADDWINVPFISPQTFLELVLPSYRAIEEQEGPINSFHTCGNMVPLSRDFCASFPELANLDVSAWNDLAELDAAVPRDRSFGVNINATMVMSAGAEEQRAHLELIRSLRRNRSIGINAQSGCRIRASYDEHIARINEYLLLARATLAHE